MNSHLVKIIRIYFPGLHGHRFKLKVGFRNLSEGIQAEKSQRQTPRERPAVRRKGVYGKGYPLLAIPIITFGLGTWQIQRREWKLNLIKELEDKMTQQPVPLPDNLEEVENMEYRKVKIRGTFDHERELFIGPRSDFRAAEELSGGSQSERGVNVVTPFKLADRDETILVNRGFVPFHNRPAQMRSEGQVQGEVEITGIVRLNEKKKFIASDPFRDGYWLGRDIDQMADIAGTAKVFVDADANSTVPGGPRGGQTRVSLRNEHGVYILTWYALCAFTFYLWYKNYRSPSPHRTIVEYVKKTNKRL